MAGRHLVIGGDGLIGRALVEHLRREGVETLTTTRRPEAGAGALFLDLNQELAAWEPPTEITAAWLCAGVPRLMDCRRRPTETARINIAANVALAKKLLARGAQVIFPSTNLVFDGATPERRAEAAACPVTEYGRQKAEAEKQLLALDGAVIVVRLTKVFGPGFPLFNEWKDALVSGQPVTPFSDRFVAPLPLPFVLEIFSLVAEKRLGGILQISGNRDLSYEQVARHLARRVGARQDLVRAISAPRGEEGAVRQPAYTTLDTSRLRQELERVPPEVWQAVDLAAGL